MRISGVVFAFATFVAVLVVAAPGLAAPAESREAYVGKLEPICKRDYQRSTPLINGTQRLIRQGRYGVAAARVGRAARIFDSTLRRIRVIEPTPSDAATVKRWFKQLDLQARYLHQLVGVLKSKNKRKIDSFTVKMMRNAYRANNTVFLFEFDHCLLPAGL